jgi:hypothetical protein
VAPYNKKGPGAPTHVLVDMLGHPAVELTQAEDAVGSGARADAAAPASIGGSGTQYKGLAGQFLQHECTPIVVPIQ